VEAISMVTMKSSSISRVACALIGLLLLTSVGSAQENSAPRPSSNTVRRSVEPSFNIEPIIHRFKGRRGEVIPFSFTIGSLGKEMQVSITPVELRQEENGVILNGVFEAANPNIRLTSPAEFDLRPGESKEIQGQVTIPIARTNFLSYGILVRDNGVMTDANTDDVQTQTSARVKFITQYILRIDVDTGVQDTSDMKKLIVEQGQIICEDGNPQLLAYLTNPTESAIECDASALLTTAGTENKNSVEKFRLMLPCRRALEEKDRYLVRILAKSRVRLEAPIEMLLPPGERTLTIALSAQGRNFQETSFSQTIAAGQFPRMETKMAILGNDFSVQPAQIEVSSSGNRSSTLHFHNASSEPRLVNLSLRDLQGNELPGLRLSHDRLEIKPGRSKNARLTIQGGSPVEALSGRLFVEFDGHGRKFELPVAAFPKNAAVKLLDISELEIATEKDSPIFTVPVKNPTEQYVPIHGTLQVVDIEGKQWLLKDGYGKWLAPGETQLLRFQPTAILNPGEYQLSLTIESTKNVTPYARTLMIKLGDGKQSPTSLAAGTF
jgi:hypothetical protein